MMKLFGRRRPRPEPPPIEPTYISTRTGGYEMERESDYQAGDEDTILDHSLYTTADYSVAKSTVISTATTVKYGRPQLPRQVLETSDIRSKLELYQQNRQQLGRFSPIMESPSSTQGEAVSTTPRWGCSSRKDDEESDSSCLDSSLRGLHLVPDDTDSKPQTPYRFELATMEEMNKRKIGDENTSVHSFSFSQNEDEVGFELDDPEPIINNAAQMKNKNKQEEDHFKHYREQENGNQNVGHDCDDEESLESEPSIDVASRMNVTDAELLYGRSSSGALRLTAEGLQQHEKKTFQEARRKPEKHADEFEAWRKEHETRKWYRKKLKEREQRLLDANLQLRESQKTPDSKPEKKRAVSFHCENNTVGDVSLGALEKMQDLNLNTNQSTKKRNFPLFRKKNKPTAEEILQQERQRAREAKRFEEFQIRQEKERIERRRRYYLEKQRAKEIVASNRLDRTGSWDTQPLTSTSSLSTVQPSMPFCVFCEAEVRTHIATPCMHFSFCASCVKKLQASGKNQCPVCLHPNVTYAPVAI